MIDKRRYKHPKKVKYLALDDLKSIGHVLGHKSDMDMQMQNMRFAQEAAR